MLSISFKMLLEVQAWAFDQILRSESEPESEFWQEVYALATAWAHWAWQSAKLGYEP